VIEEKINKWMGAEFHAEAAQAESAAVDQQDLQEELRYRERVTAGSAQAIRQTQHQADAGQADPLEPKTDRTAPFKPTEQKKPQREDRRQIERRQKQTQEHSTRRSNEKKPDNPVWDKVLNQQTKKTESAVETLSKGLAESLKKPQQEADLPVDKSHDQTGHIQPGETVKF